MDLIKKRSGYTLVEVLVAMGIFSIVLTITTSITVNFYNAQKRERIRNTLIEESQFLLNRLAGLIRDNTVDYSGYFSNNREETPYPASDRSDIVYGNEPKEYEWRFFHLPTCQTDETPGTDDYGDGIVCDRDDPNSFNEGYFDTLADMDRLNDQPGDTALIQVEGAANVDGYQQWELYLVSTTGTYKTILRRLNNGVDDDEDGTVDEDGDTFWQAGADGNIDGGERLGILEIEANEDLDSPLDGELDFVSEEENFQADGDTDIEFEDFIAISPRLIDIVDLKFFVSPLDDPRKAFSENSAAVQIQPHVTILLTTRPGRRLMRQIPGSSFDLSVQTTVSSRILSNVLFPDP